jgi:hypothetical protein
MNNSNIIDNRKVLMVDVVNDLLAHNAVSRFALGYFYLGGFKMEPG